MSIGSISGSRYESMRSQMETFRSGKTRIQKADLEEIKSAGASQASSPGSAAGGLEELIEKFSEIDTDGDGLSTEELQKAIESGTITAPEKRQRGPGGPGGPGGPPPGGGKGPPPGGPKGTGVEGGEEDESGVAQSDLMGYNLFAEYLKDLQAKTAEMVAATEETSETATDQTKEVDPISLLNQSSKAETETKASQEKAGNLMKLLTQQLFKAYNQQNAKSQLNDSSFFGNSMVA